MVTSGEREGGDGQDGGEEENGVVTGLREIICEIFKNYKPL